MTKWLNLELHMMIWREKSTYIFNAIWHIWSSGLDRNVLISIKVDARGGGVTGREQLSFEPIVPGQWLGPVFDGAAAATATTAIVAAAIASAVAAVPGWATATWG